MVISASLQAWGVVFPFAMLTSICRSIVTICSGLYLLIGMTRFSSKWILSHSTWYKVCRSRHVDGATVVLRYRDNLDWFLLFINFHHVRQRFFDVTVFIQLRL